MLETEGEHSFGALLRRHRLAAGLTQATLAEKAGISTRGVQDLERGVSRPHRDTLLRLEAALDLSTGEQTDLRAVALPTPRRGTAAPQSGYSWASTDGPSIRGNLPLQLSSFIGRAQEQVELHRLLEHARLVTLTGAGGIGKTRLALELATSRVSLYPDGVWLVELASLTDPTLVAPAAASLLGVREHVGQPLFTALSDAVQNRTLLLVLDNCEHVLDACAELSAHVLATSPFVRILATSRQPLGITGEVVRHIPPLKVPGVGSHPDLEQLCGYESVRLFIDRAIATTADFAVTERSASAVAEVCRRLDGMPLAVELAAARTRLLSVEQIADQLNRALRLLTAGARGGPARHQTLRAALDWSYNLLSTPEQRLFARLAVFAGGWTLEAGEAVGASDDLPSSDVLNVLAGLVDKSMIVTEPQPDATVRYRLLEPVRQYSQQVLDANGEAEIAGKQHALYFLSLGEQAEPHLRGGTEFWMWLGRLAPEQGNLRAALRWCIAQDEVDYGLRLGGAVWRWWLERGTHEDCRQWLDLLTRLWPDSARNAYTARALNGAGVLASGLGDLATAERLLEESRAMWTELGEILRAGACVHNLAAVARDRGDHVAAESLFEDALAIARDHADRVREALILTSLGTLLVERGRAAQAREVSATAIGIYRELDDDFSAVWPKMNLAWAMLLGDDPAAARALFAENLVFMRGQPDSTIDPFCEGLEGMAAVAGAEGEFARALRLASAASQLRRKAGRAWEQTYSKWVNSWLEPLREGINQHAGDAAWGEGEHMSLAEAIEYALAQSTMPRAEV